MVEHEDGPALIPSRIGEGDGIRCGTERFIHAASQPFLEGKNEASLGLVANPTGDLGNGIDKELFAGLEALGCREATDGVHEMTIDKRESEFQAAGHAHDIAVTKQLVAHVFFEFERRDLVFRDEIGRRGGE